MRNPRQYHQGYVLDAITWQRCLKGMVMLLLFFAASGMAQSTAQVVQKMSVADSEEGFKQRLLADSRRQKEAAEQTRKYFQSDAGVLAAARPYGWGRQGEHRVMFDAPKPPPPPKSTRKD